MDIESLKMRIYFIAGQLEEAKKLYAEIMEERKKQPSTASTTETAPGAKVTE